MQLFTKKIYYTRLQSIFPSTSFILVTLYKRTKLFSDCYSKTHCTTCTCEYAWLLGYVTETYFHLNTTRADTKKWSWSGCCTLQSICYIPVIIVLFCSVVGHLHYKTAHSFDYLPFTHYYCPSFHIFTFADSRRHLGVAILPYFFLSNTFSFFSGDDHFFLKASITQQQWNNMDGTEEKVASSYLNYHWDLGKTIYGIYAQQKKWFGIEY